MMSTQRLAEIVQEKENKARAYASCDAYWLLVIINFIDPAQEQEIRREEGLAIASGVFQKVICSNQDLI
jgi:hypothetical protein